MSNSILHSKRVLITAGPTREAIDPVRYISNHSTGKMGYAIAEYLLSLGANVHVVSGPVSLHHQVPTDRITHVISADEMLEASKQLADTADLIIFTAAVADYKCATIANQKIKKKDDVLSIDLIPNPDIAFELSKTKKSHQTFIGFALETENGIEHACSKMKRKGFDSVILNIHDSHGSGFGHDTNKIQIMDSDFSVTDYSLKQKSEVAVDIVNHIANKLAIKEVEAIYA